MKDNERTTEVSIEVTSTRMGKNGELIDAIAAGAKLTKADAGRTAYVDNDSLTVKIDGSETTKAEIDYNGSSKSTGDDASINKTVEVTVKEQTTDAKGEVSERPVGGSKLTKADAGRMANETAEDWFNFQVEDAGDGSAPVITTRSNSKLTKADAGKTESNA
jgi:hypothetical protein